MPNATLTPISALREPLTEVLGSPVRVRVLRTLAATPAAIPISTLAREAGVNLRGLRAVLRLLERYGAVEIGAGHGARVSLRPTWVLTSAVRGLFHAEATRWREALAAITALLDSLEPRVRGAWLAGPHAAATDGPLEPLVIVLWTTPAVLASQVAAVAAGLATLTATYDLPAPEVIGRTDPELHAPAADDPAVSGPVLLLTGVLPPALRTVTGRPAASHADRETQAWQRAGAVATLLLREPTLLPRTTALLEQRVATAPVRQRALWQEWLTLVRTQPRARLAALLTRRDARMTRLRQSLPFLEVLTPTERHEVERVVSAART